MWYSGKEKLPATSRLTVSLFGAACHEWLHTARGDSGQFTQLKCPPTMPLTQPYGCEPVISPKTSLAPLTIHTSTHSLTLAKGERLELNLKMNLGVLTITVIYSAKLGEPYYNKVIWPIKGEGMVWLSLTSQVIQILQHLFLSGKVQGKGVEGVRQMDLWDQHLSGCRCHGNPRMTGKNIFTQI